MAKKRLPFLVWDGVKPGFEIKPFSPVHFAEKHVTIQEVFWSLSGYRELKLSKKPFTGHTLQGPMQM